MTTGNDTPEPADGDESAARAGPVRRHRRAVLGLVAIAAVLASLGLVAVLTEASEAETDSLGSATPALSHFTMQPGGECTYAPDRGGLVAHFDVRTSESGRFTVDLEAVTDEGSDNLDIPTPHVVRVTVPFYGGQSRKEFDVVVPLTEADYQDGYRKCRYAVNGRE